MKVLFFIILSLLSQTSFSEQKKLLLVAPYMPENNEKDGKSGRDITILTKILDCAGYRPTFEIQPYIRHLKSFLNSSKYDGVATIPETNKEIKEKSHPYIAYHNGVIVRDQDFPNGISTIDDLKGRNIISFTGGKLLLKGLKDKVSSFASYTETTKQYLHNEMLMKKRVDGVFSDGLIFMAHQRRLIENEPRWKKIKVKFYRIFSVNHFSVSFRDPKITKKFNYCLQKLNQDGSLNTIERSFADKYHGSLGSEFLNPLLRK
jgi:polar amino acid transport system substrate-binding protein